MPLLCDNVTITDYRDRARALSNQEPGRPSSAQGTNEMLQRKLPLRDQLWISVVAERTDRDLAKLLKTSFSSC